MRPGTLIGPYELSSQLGQGGVGVVFRALDTKLHRAVAIKFLSNECADVDARRRFQREAQLASSLNHPHILTVHDVGEFEESQYLVTEFVDGGTLQDWIGAEQRTWRQVVDILVGVADGLAAAHQAGILHRDIKPQNVLVAKNGYAKLADFGLAKLGAAGGETGAEATIADTRRGIIVGTLAYMSPEQALGKPLDARSDIFSFGVMLYELLVGRRPFAVASEIATLQNIIHASASPLDASVPLALRMIVDKALEKDPSDRYQTARDLVVDLRRLTRAGAEQYERSPSRATTSTARVRRLVFSGLMVVTAAAAGALAHRWWSGARESTATPPNAGFSQITNDIGIEEMPAVSPDGKNVAFVASRNGRRHIWVRLLSGGDAIPVTRDDGDRDHDQPRWSPDSDALIYFTPPSADGESGTLWQIPALGGNPRQLSRAITGGEISHDGRFIAAFQLVDREIRLAVLARDGTAVHKSIPVADGDAFSTPRWSPDDRSLAFVSGTPALAHRVKVMDVAAGEVRTLAETTDIKGVAWLPSGSELVYASSAGSTMLYPPILHLRLISLDGRRERQLTIGDASFMYPDVVQKGQVFASRVRLHSEIWRFPVSGSPADNVKSAVRITHQTGQVQTPSVSPDGNEVAYLSDSGGHANLWVSKTDGSHSRQLTFDRDPAVLVGIPLWSPAGNRIVFIRNSPHGQAQWLINPDGTGLRERVSGAASAAWSGDGRWLYYQDRLQSCIYKIPTEEGPAVRVRCDAAVPAPSADGRTLFFAPRYMNANEIYKASPEHGQPVPVARYALARVPWWPTGFALSPDARWLAFPLKDGATTNIWAVDTATGAFRQLTDFGERSITIARQVSWTQDGKFLYAAVAESDADVVLLDGITP